MELGLALRFLHSTGDAYAEEPLGFWKLYVTLGLDRPRDYIAALLNAEVRLFVYYTIFLLVCLPPVALSSVSPLQPHHGEHVEH